MTFWRGRSESLTILGSVMTVGVLTMCVKAMGFAKELVVANYFGTSDVMDAFVIAFMIPSVVAAVLAEGLPDALLPAYSETAAKNGKQEADALAVNSIWVYFGTLLVAFAGLLFGGEHLIRLFGANFSAEKLAVSVKMYWALLPFVVFYGMSHVFGTLLQANKRFALAAATPLLVPACSVVGLLAGYDSMGIYGLIAGVVTGSALHLAVLYYAFHQQCDRSLFVCGPWTPEVRSVIRESFPLLAGGIVMYGTTLVDNGMAAWLAPGSVAVLGYGGRICSLVLSLAAISVGKAILPYLADNVAHGQWDRLKQTLFQFSALIAVTCLPVTLILWMWAPEIVAILFERGSFSSSDTARVAGVLQYYGLQIPFYIVAVLASRVVIALRASRFILIVAVFNLTANILFNYLFIQSLGINGIALSTAVVHLVSALMLYSYIFREIARRKSSCSALAPTTTTLL
ncbi:MAG: putative peptidoglycan lipid II flippase [Verrucomicrobiales bacterium]|jgi:putative peptidoglycan lipid II flippase